MPKKAINRSKADLLRTALGLALIAHRRQTSKRGRPYVFHCLRVMESVNSIDAKIVALLHDTLEDGKQPDLHLADIEASYGETIAVAIDLLTKNPNVSYQQYIKNLAPNELAREVKIADLRDNMQIDRLPSLGEKDFERLKKYHWAHNYLTAWSEEEEDE